MAIPPFPPHCGLSHQTLCWQGLEHAHRCMCAHTSLSSRIVRYRLLYKTAFSKVCCERSSSPKSQPSVGRIAAKSTWVPHASYSRWSPTVGIPVTLALLFLSSQDSRPGRQQWCNWPWQAVLWVCALQEVNALPKGHGTCTYNRMLWTVSSLQKNSYFLTPCPSIPLLISFFWEREKHWSVASLMCLNWGPNPQSRQAPWLGIKPRPCGSGDEAPTNWVTQLGPEKLVCLNPQYLSENELGDRAFKEIIKLK